MKHLKWLTNHEYQANINSNQLSKPQFCMMAHSTAFVGYHGEMGIQDINFPSFQKHTKLLLKRILSTATTLLSTQRPVKRSFFPVLSGESGGMEMRTQLE
ncbi:hypothetical protein DK846_01870 [Methanospirillum lacunae]|uniref:Uncharacterized protein n=1 Tax=Methanospirillum lacunae TaxID=668570 RepID=A0A2V2NC61_9EURY|nr:hypothetical protein DK846_01870 [Methanospirillum lacunae]